MNKQEIEILNEIIDNMNKIITEKEKQYQDTWIFCDLTFLKAKLLEQFNKLLIPSFKQDELRIITHIFNYAFFLYCRYKFLMS